MPRESGRITCRLALLATALVVGACSDATAPGDAPPPPALLACLDRMPAGEPGCAITPDSSHATMPEISGDRIVWQDYRSGPPAIFLLDLGTLVITQVSPPGTNDVLPVIDGNRIVYVRFLGCPFPNRFYSHDIPSGTATLFHEVDCTVGLGRLSISGDRVAWHEKRDDNWDVYLHDFSTSTETRITTDPAEQADPSIHGEIITWLDRRRGETWWDVYMLDLRTGAERRLTQESPTAGRGPVVSAQRVIWGDTRGGYFTLHESTLPDQPVRAVATPLLENGLAASPSGRYAAWVDRNDEIPFPFDDVFLYDFLTSTALRLTSDPSVQWTPALSDEYVVWEDYRSGYAQIFVARLSRLPWTPSLSRDPIPAGSRQAFHLGAEPVTAPLGRRQP